SADCDEGCGCYLVEELYPGYYIPHNECICNECSSDEDCSVPDNQICVPAGVWGYQLNHCIFAPCKVHSDCVEGSSGICIPYYDRCATVTTFSQKTCKYESDPCQTDDDCDTGDLCLPPQVWDSTDGYSCQPLYCPGK
ncbi:MAG: hypothetical protein JXX29_18890, partial [Deltaproteobacteria bacterium]|nr:hypothetical protein [Deltaproteobacteria bacterium]MBN2673753.1 hypothetical protein [Deltaproteobacteria bacterium]